MQEGCIDCYNIFSPTEATREQDFFLHKLFVKGRSRSIAQLRRGLDDSPHLVSYREKCLLNPLLWGFL